MKLQLSGIPLNVSPNYRAYQTKLLYSNIARMLDESRLYAPNQSELPDQCLRKLNPANATSLAIHLKDCIESDQPIFLPPIVLNAQPASAVDYRDGVIQVAYDAVFRICDGQTRCFGIRRSIELLRSEENPDWQLIHAFETLELGAVLYCGLPLEWERQMHRDANCLAKRPVRDLCVEFDSRATSATIARAIRDEVFSVEFYVDLVRATRWMFPKLNVKTIGFRQQWAIAFWQAVKSVLPWDSDSITTTSVALQGLGKWGGDLWEQDQIPTEDLAHYVAPLARIDWSRSNPLWQEIGVTSSGRISSSQESVVAFSKALQQQTGLGLSCVL